MRGPDIKPINAILKKKCWKQHHLLKLVIYNTYSQSFILAWESYDILTAFYQLY